MPTKLHTLIKDLLVFVSESPGVDTHGSTLFKVKERIEAILAEHKASEASNLSIRKEYLDLKNSQSKKPPNLIYKDVQEGSEFEIVIWAVHKLKRDSLVAVDLGMSMEKLSLFLNMGRKLKYLGVPDEAWQENNHFLLDKGKDLLLQRGLLT